MISRGSKSGSEIELRSEVISSREMGQKMTTFLTHFLMFFMKNTDFSHFRCFSWFLELSAPRVPEITFNPDINKHRKTVKNGDFHTSKKGSRKVVKFTKKWSHRGLKVDFYQKS